MSFEQVFDSIESFPLSNRRTPGIVNRRIADRKRDEIFRDYLEAKSDLENGIIKPEYPEDFFKRMMIDV